MKLTEMLERGLTAWTATVATAIEAVADWQLRRPRVRVSYDRPDHIALTMQPPPQGRPALSQTSMNLANGGAGALPAEWLKALRGCTLEVHLTAEMVLVRPLDFPRQAEPFLEGMIRTQIGRFTPWTLDQAVYGFSAPRAAAPDRITLTLVATRRASTEPLLAFAADVGAATIAISADDGSPDAAPVQIYKASLRSAFAGGRDLGHVLKLGWLSVAAATAVLLVATTLTGALMDGELEDAQAQVTRLRAALRPAIGAASAADGLLAKRKQTSPASVMVLDTLSKILPDDTYVTELHVENDRLQISGVTQDAPALIRLIEQSPQFSRATFYAPTTRSPGEAGERFHVEARINAYFGDPA
ncbi:PilN domain-containing protein [Bradyrhizobium oligotrophicum]|uniref:PilN domain-containing protein n=1 Tax=Bradyrhizobium oligotrophicum TaxID=44255 RepID=UPI003EC090CA